MTEDERIRGRPGVSFAESVTWWSAPGDPGISAVCHDGFMASVDRARARAIRRLHDTLVRIGSEYREARIGIGASQAHVGHAADVSPSQVGRIERAVLTHVSLEDLNAIAVVLGLDLSVRTYPGSAPIRDVAHVRLVERFRDRCHASLRWTVEVPLGLSGDQRAWDATIGASDGRIAVEAETRLRDTQALIRRIALKQADDHMGRVILVVAHTHTNRAAISAARVEFETMFPLRTRGILASLAIGALPDRSGIVIL